MHGIRTTFGALIVGVLLAACSSAYYGVMEQFGVHKRDILVDRIEDAQKAQQDGQQQFKDALEQFRSVVNFDGGELEQIYNRLNSEYEDSEAAATRIRDRIKSVESVASALFREWERELRDYTNETLRRDSERQLRETRERYERVITAMHRAEATMDPVLNNLRDNVLYLKHNLNARAVASLRGELDSINTDVDRLIQAMGQAIAESDRFIADMRQG
jgi:DNA repair exonuclease SbcCD ATPase subunit